MTARSERPSGAALVLALAVPFVFLHDHYQVSVTAGPLTADLTDFAILAAVVAALVSLSRDGAAPLRGARLVWWPLVAFCALAVLSLAWARHLDPGYALTDHAVSLAKFLEYVCLAPAVPLALRREVDRRWFLMAALAWSSFLTAIGILQFLGIVPEFKGLRPEQREPSYIGVHDFGAFSGTALSICFAAILLRTRRREGIAGGLAGAFGIAIAAALDSVGGMAATAAATFALARRRGPVGARRALSIAAITVLVAIAAVTLRGSAIKSFLAFLGVAQPKQNQTQIETYAQRTVLLYIGLEIWVHHPLLGVGWQESARPHAFRPYLASAHRHFPNAAPASFPSEAHLWGIQNGALQTLADLGIVGGLLLLAVVVATARLLVRVAGRGPPDLLFGAIVATGWLLFALAVFTGSGLLPGIAVDAQLWLAVGLAVSLHNSLASRG